MQQSRKQANSTSNDKISTSKSYIHIVITNNDYHHHQPIVWSPPIISGHHQQQHSERHTHGENPFEPPTNTYICRSCSDRSLMYANFIDVLWQTRDTYSCYTRKCCYYYYWYVCVEGCCCSCLMRSARVATMSWLMCLGGVSVSKGMSHVSWCAHITWRRNYSCVFEVFCTSIWKVVGLGVAVPLSLLLAVMEFIVSACPFRPLGTLLNELMR